MKKKSCSWTLHYQIPKHKNITSKSQILKTQKQHTSVEIDSIATRSNWIETNHSCGVAAIRLGLALSLAWRLQWKHVCFSRIQTKINYKRILNMQITERTKVTSWQSFSVKISCQFRVWENFMLYKIRYKADDEICVLI